LQTEIVVKLVDCWHRFWCGYKYLSIPFLFQTTRTSIYIREYSRGDRNLLDGYK
jgi:hypothetical protein